MISYQCATTLLFMLTALGAKAATPEDTWTTPEKSMKSSLQLSSENKRAVMPNSWGNTMSEMKAKMESMDRTIKEQKKNYAECYNAVLEKNTALEEALLRISKLEAFEKIKEKYRADSIVITRSVFFEMISKRHQDIETYMLDAANMQNLLNAMKMSCAVLLTPFYITMERDLIKAYAYIPTMLPVDAAMKAFPENFGKYLTSTVRFLLMQFTATLSLIHDAGFALDEVTLDRICFKYNPPLLKATTSTTNLGPGLGDFRVHLMCKSGLWNDEREKRLYQKDKTATLQCVLMIILKATKVKEFREVGEELIEILLDSLTAIDANRLTASHKRLNTEAKGQLMPVVLEWFDFFKAMLDPEVPTRDLLVVAPLSLHISEFYLVAGVWK